MMSNEFIAILNESKRNSNLINKFFWGKGKALKELDEDSKQAAKVIEQNANDIIDRIDRLLVNFNKSLDSKTITIYDVIGCVCAKYGLTQEQLCKKTNRHAITFPRQIVMYICASVLSNSYTQKEIGVALKGFHRTTVLHALNVVPNDIAKDPVKKAQYDSIIDMLNNLYSDGRVL